jgi:hypothetical protein
MPLTSGTRPGVYEITWMLAGERRGRLAGAGQ